jgi:hypothetical protein
MRDANKEKEQRRAVYIEKMRETDESLRKPLTIMIIIISNIIDSDQLPLEKKEGKTRTELIFTIVQKLIG